MVPYWLTVIMMAMFHPVASQSEFTTQVVVSALKLSVVFLFPLINYFWIFFHSYPRAGTLHFVCSLNLTVIHQTTMAQRCRLLPFSLSDGDSQYVSLCIKLNWLKIWTRHDSEFEAVCAIYLVGVFFSFRSLLLISPLLSQWGLTSLLRETTVISRVVCVCLNVRVC